jgi:hypothetical protein
MAASSSSSSTDDVTGATDAQLQARAAKGDAKAIQELQKREAAKAQGKDDGIGTNVDTYA